MSDAGKRYNPTISWTVGDMWGQWRMALMRTNHFRTWNSLEEKTESNPSAILRDWMPAVLTGWVGTEFFTCHPPLQAFWK